MEAPKQNFYLIQALRFLAALMVVCCHATFYTQERLLSSVAVFGLGSNGVPLFFVISGFVIVLASQKLINDKNGWKKFAAKRIIRIVPLYWMLTSFKIVVMAFSAGLILHSNIDFTKILQSFFFIPPLNIDGQIQPILGVGWTLNFEMFFYLLFTIAILLRINTLLFSGIIMIALTVLSFFKTPEWPVAISFYANPIVINFLFGMMAAAMITKNYKTPKPLAITLLFVGLAYLFSPLQYQLHFAPFTAAIANAIASFSVVYCCAQLEKNTRIQVPSFIVFFGAASYSLYLIHPVIAPLSPTVLKKIGLISPFLSVVFCIVLALIAAAITYSFFEKPVSKLLNKKFLPKAAMARAEREVVAAE